MHTIARRLTFFIILLLCAFKTMAQTAGSIPLFYEKVFLHTDRDIYTQGEDVWFKAYLVDAQNNKPINYSHNLYVELISPGLKIITLHVLRLEQGLGNGDFKLADTLSAGTYRLRAYTNWMRNFGDNFIFEKNITIVNTTGKQSIAAALAKPVKRFKKKPSVLSLVDTLPAGPLVRFFPEGGALVNNVSSVVAVKAEDEMGRGIAVSGQVLATSGRTVAKFVCDSLGFGAFTLQPDETQNYHAEVNIKGKPYNFKVREARIKGFTLGANSVSPFIIADVNCNGYSLSESGGTNLVIVGSHAGKILFKDQFRIQSKNILVQIPDANFPEGIAKITLFDEHATPLAERLVYVQHANSTKLTVSTDSVSYHPRQKVVVKIKLSDSTRTNLSLAAVDAGVIAVKPENILSYLELKSEIRGNIEHPERYFDASNNNRQHQLDLLLMTQGWRDFVWKDIEDTKFKQQYDVEQALTLTGHVRGVWLNKALPKMNITMFAPKATGNRLFYTQSDSLGKFRIDGVIFYGYKFINFNSRRSDGLETNGKSDGKTGGWIFVDSMYQDKPAIKPVNTSLSDTLALNLDSVEKFKQFTFSGNNKLNTVQIKSNTDEIPTQNFAVSAVEQKEYGSLGQFAASMIPGAHWEWPLLHTNYFQADQIVSISASYSDNSKIGAHVVDEYWGEPMDRVLKVNIRGIYTFYGPKYTVQVVLRPGALEVKDTYDNTMADVVGYTKARTFFAPRYNEPNTKPDYRTTIYWEPNITTDEKGEATLTYYNADPKSKIRLIVQGVTDKGVPVVASTGYVVK